MKPTTPAQESDLPKLGQPALRALYGAGCTRLEQVAAFSLSDLKKLHGIGPNAIQKLKLAMAEKGLAFAITNQEINRPPGPKDEIA